MLFSLKEGQFNVTKNKQKVIFHMHSQTKGYFFFLIFDFNVAQCVQTQDIWVIF